MELQNTVKQALNVLYHHTDDAVRLEADRWLQEFQGTLDAWQVCDNLLHDASSNPETLIFCSQTLRSKVQRYFEELPSEAFRPLRDSLNTLLKTFHKGPPKVRTQISLAIAALAVHVPAEDWGDGGIVNWLRDEMNSHHELIPSFLELLTVLPEEVFNYKIAARPNRRQKFEKELSSATEVAMGILTACLSINELKEQVLEAFASWLRLRHRIPASTLASHPLVLTALSSLNSDVLSEASVNGELFSLRMNCTTNVSMGSVALSEWCAFPSLAVQAYFDCETVAKGRPLPTVISELIHYTAARNSGGFSVQMPLIQLIVPQVMNLKAQLRDSSKDEEDVKAIARLFADMGDSYIELIATGSDESMLIVHALLEVASHPENDIASMTFNFWHDLQIILIERDSYVSLGNEAAIDAEKNRRLQIFRASYESLVSLVSFRVQYPQDYSGLTKEDQKDFKQTRYGIGFALNRGLSVPVADVLIDAALVLGGEVTLKILYMKLLEALGICGNNESSDWCPAEAALYCIRAISDYVSSTEAEVMPQIMALLPNLTHQPQLLQTVCLTVGAYSKWLDAASSGLSFLPSVIDILVSGMSMSEDPAAAAASAFRNICDDCGKKFCGSLDGLFQIYQRAMTGEGVFKLSAEDSYVNHPEAVADAIQRLWPIFKAIFDLRAWDMGTMESLCRACKHAVRTSKRFMGITIGAILEEIEGLYKQHHQPCFLYLSSEVIKIYGSDPSCANYLKILIESLFNHTAYLLTKIQVTYALVALTRACGMPALGWAKESVSLIPLSVVTEEERSRFLQALSQAASGPDTKSLTVPFEELAEVCRRNRTVQEIVLGALRPLELNIVTVP
ncbi:hypothetical protein RJ639_036637 [Escallonia herrerae]|uniref:Importin N-terminal domain-containing protein n=1 Tax=Escallonia herrerae TaxID=1293975 RepID=A0AA89BC67_9ASTE|nr:hypothetical protein RJ639_036637 [Escallonia herrerae]